MAFDRRIWPPYTTDSSRARRAGEGEPRHVLAGLVLRRVDVGRFRVQGHAHPDRARRAPRLGSKRPLRGERGGHALRRGVEGGAERVPDNLEHVAAGQLNRLLEQSVMADEGVIHRLGMLLPEPRAALDVREEEGDRAGGQRQHVHALAPMRLTLSDRRSAVARPALNRASRRGSPQSQEG